MKNPIIDKILTEWAYRVHDGSPDPTNPYHLVLLERSMNGMGLPRRFKTGLLQRLRELEFNDEESFKKYKSDLKGGEIRPTTKVTIGGKETTAGEIEGDEEDKFEVLQLNQQQQQISDDLDNGNLDEITKSQDNLAVRRAKGDAGAGGPVASQGESVFVEGANKLPSYNNLKPVSKQEKDQIKNRRTNPSKRYPQGKPNYPNAEEIEMCETLGLDPISDDALEYLARRERYSRQKLEEIKKDPDSVFYISGSKGFSSSEDAYLEWMRADFDGAMALKDDIDKNSNIDTSKPHTVLQSDDTPEGHDQAIKDHLRKKYEETKDPHYKRQLELMDKIKFHDTFAIGQDSEGRTQIYHISNKKATDISDPHNNTSPARRIKIIQEAGFGPQVAIRVGQSLKNGLDAVEDVKQSTVKSSQKVPIDNDLVKVCKMPSMKKYMDQLDNNKKFMEWVKSKGISYKTTADKLAALQMYSKELTDAGKEPAYAPFGKIFIKVGEITRTKKWQKANPGIDVNSGGILESRKIKEKEQDVVKGTYKDVVDNITEADKADGFPDKNGNNGPHTQGYISTVLDSMHVGTYIENYDGDASIVMGGRIAHPKDIRNALASLTGYDKNNPEPHPKDPEKPTPEEKKAIKKWRQGLVDHLKKKCKINAETGHIEINGPDGDGNIPLFKDEWRTAGTAQKVASYYGEGMQKYMKQSIDSRRQKQTSIGKP